MHRSGSSGRERSGAHHSERDKSENRDNDRFKRNQGNTQQQRRSTRNTGRQGLVHIHGNISPRSKSGLTIKREAKPLHPGMLQKLATLSPEDITLHLLAQHSGLNEFLNIEYSPPNIVQDFIKVLAKTCDSHSPTNLTELFVLVSDAEPFLSCLTNYIRSMPRQTSLQAYEHFPNFIKSISVVFRHIFEHLPSRHENVTEAYESLLAAVRSLQRMKIITDEELFQNVKELEEIKDNIYHKERQGMQKKLNGVKGRIDDDPIQPPNDFRDLPEFPEKDELRPDYQPFLRPSIVFGSYNDLDHYLDVQYRLYREDFISPLRDSLDEYTNYMDKPVGRGPRRFQDIRVYHNVHILGCVCNTNGLNHMIEFDTTYLKRVQWEFSKRLIFGSLLCLSSDGFSTLIFASVANREVKKLKDGMIEVRFQGGAEAVSRLDQAATYDMIETMAYFEACRHVLCGLQQMKTIPFENYIVSCESKVKPPRYLTDKTEFDFSPMLEEDVSENTVTTLEERFKQLLRKTEVKTRMVRVLKQLDWPDKDELHLDNSQFEAVKTALTKEFAIIQGPPGTGKTYVGLKIVKTLLKNKHIWQTRRTSPLLVVCYTNHALDQFLEGIHEFLPKGIVRAGSRSNNETLKRYSLSELRQDRRQKREVRGEIYINRRQMREELGVLSKTLSGLNERIVHASTALLNIQDLQVYMQDDHVYQLMEYMNIMGYQSVRPVHVWLGADVTELAAEEQQDVLENPGNIAETEAEMSLDVQGEADAIGSERLDDDENVRIGKGVDFKLQYDNSQATENERKQNEWTVIAKKRRLTNRHIKQQLQMKSRMIGLEVDGVSNIWLLQNQDRWRLYRFWLDRLLRDLRRERMKSEIKFETLSRLLEEVVQQEDKDILQDATVIGITTTGAARLMKVLQQIQPPVIVVEEAAEVLEAHIITALSDGCQHLILIGDHKQLRPNPTVYRLAREYNLEVSLFERMVKNGMPFECLEQQHRMRPEISILMRHIYRGLKDHASVKNMENIKGVSSNIFLIDHEAPETHNEELMSRANEHEARYILALCQYLLKQDYSPSQITILTTYKGQLFKMKALMKKNAKAFADVHTTAVDNFQGEENDIILLSLVRSNQDNQIGFLNVDNRVCVALSRARKGFYVIGNFTLFASQSQLWQKIVSDMQKEKRIGKSLLLTCQKHPQTTINAAVDSDFRRAPEGGCMMPCESRMLCGHQCMLPCHPYDPEHKVIRCMKRCEKLLCDLNHQCPKKCWEECSDCQVLVDKVIPQCSHTQKVPCHVLPSLFSCKMTCLKTLQCGHKCEKKCGELCRKKCETATNKKLTCGHDQIAMCWKCTDSIICTTPCNQKLECGHVCRGTCGECRRGRFHINCQSPCGRILVCGHTCRWPCSEDCRPCSEPCPNYCEHSRCKKRCGEACAQCRERCSWRCQHFECSQKCGDPCDRPMCNKPCNKILACKHNCIGICGEPCPKRCRVCNREEVTEILFGDEDEPNARFVELDCGHVIEVKAMDKWMSKSTDTDNEGSNSEQEQTIQLRTCPKCKCNVMKTPRYGNIIKSILEDIERVKFEIRGGDTTLKVAVLNDKYTRMKVNGLFSIEDGQVTKKKLQQLKVEELNSYLQRLMNEDLGQTTSACEMILQSICQRIEDEFIAAKNVTISSGEVSLLETKLNVTSDIRKLLRRLLQKDKERNSLLLVERHSSGKQFISQIIAFVEWLFRLPKGISGQQYSDMSLELERLFQYVDVVLMKRDQISINVQFEESDQKRLDGIHQKLFKTGVRLKDKDLETIRDFLTDLRKRYPSLTPVTKEERAQIVKAMGLRKGHWYKCPQGHIYAIGDCGGPNQASNCPECGAAIGGQNQQLAVGNLVATEMDGAAYGAFTNEANLQLGPQVLYED